MYEIGLYYISTKSYLEVSMNTKLFDKIHKINYLAAELDALYHQASLKIGMADSVMCVLYAIHENGESCLLSDIYKQSGISKQTVNSAIRKLEDDGILYLEQYKGKAKMVLLTDKGKQYVSETVSRLCEAEIAALETWTDAEIDTHISLLEKYVTSFKAQAEKL